MNFDFRSLYKDYPTTELLKITMRPSGYQPEAVATASELLKTRTATDADIDFVENFYHQQDLGEQKSVAYKASDLLSPVLQPRKKADARKWTNLMCLGITLQYIWQLWDHSRSIRYFITFGEWYASIYFELLGVVYTPVIFFLLLKRNRWGWILLLFGNLYGFLSNVNSVLIANYYGGYNAAPSHLFQLAIGTAFITVLLRDDIVAYFSITDDIKKKTVGVTAIVALISILSSIGTIYAYRSR